MWVGILLAFGTMLAGPALHGRRAEVPGELDAFSASIGGSADCSLPRRPRATIAAGIELNPPFSLLATLLIAPIAWTSLQWATYSCQQNGEIKDAAIVPQTRRSSSSAALVVTGLLLALLAFALERTVGTEFLYVAGAGYWSRRLRGDAGRLLPVAEHHRHRALAPARSSS